MSLAGRFPCGVAATLASVTSEDLAAVALGEMEVGTRAGTIAFSDRPGVRALIKTMESVNSDEYGNIYNKKRSTRMVAKSSVIQKGQPLVTER